MKQVSSRALIIVSGIIAGYALCAEVSLAAGAGGSDGAGGTYDPYPGPSPYGPDDEAGASNTQTPAQVLKAKALIKTGQVYRLGHLYEPTIPEFPGNQGLSLEVKPIQRLAQQIVNTELLHGEITQMGTQFDGLGHFALLPPGSSDPGEALYYNQFTGAETISAQGLLHLGVETARPFVTRGVLLDIKRYANGGQTLEPGQEITVDMVRTTLAAQKMKESDVGVGDVVLFVTGWEENWALGTEGYYTTPGLGLAEPGLGLDVARWLSARGVACVGADNWGLDVAPPAGPAAPGVLFPVHHHLLVKSGIFMQESMVLYELAEDLARDHMKNGNSGVGSYEFFYVFSPVPFKGASGSPGIPLAIR